jgi:hypothetical protein
VSPTGYLFIIGEDPVCTRGSHVCRWIPFAGATVSVLRNSRIVAHGRLNARGRGTVHVRPLRGRYELAARGTLRGSPFKLKVKLVNPVAGLMFPFTVNICPPGAFC